MRAVELAENAGSNCGVRKDGTGAKRMTGVVTRDSAQRLRIDRHRSDARDLLLHCRPPVPHQADRRCRRAAPDPARQIARSPTGPPPQPLRRLHAKAAYPHHLYRIPNPQRAPQCLDFRNTGQTIEPGRSGPRSSTTSRLHHRHGTSVPTLGYLERSLVSKIILSHSLS